MKSDVLKINPKFNCVKLSKKLRSERVNSMIIFKRK